VKGLVSK